MSQLKFIPSLTPLRGIAAMLVVIFHFHVLIGPLTSPENFIVSKFYLMVDLFFVLSGFVVLHVYGETFSSKIDKGDFWKFMKARFARIYPLHLFTFLYLFGWTLYLKSQIVFEDTPAVVQNILDNTAIPGTLTLTQAWGTHMEATWNSAAWSVSVEWFLYLLFPFLAWIMYKSNTVVKLLLGVLSLIGLFGISYILEPVWIAEMNILRESTAQQLLYRTPNTIDIITGFALLRGLCSFIFGMLAYELYKREIGQSLLKNGYWFVLLWVGLLLFWYKNLLPDPLVILVFTLLILHTAYAEGRVKTILNGKLLTYLGKISYSIYMVHIPLILTAFVLSLLQGEMPPPPEEISYVNNWIGAVILLLIVIVIASLTYRFVEQPARRKLKGL